MTAPTEQMYQPQVNAQKFKELLLHIAERSVDDANFGKTKLNKIFYYIDFMAYGMLGSPVTGATYQRRPYGPVPKEIASLRSALVNSGEAVVENVQSFNFTQERLVARRPANLSVFSGAEVRLIEGVLTALREHNAVGASELSHRELGWQAARDRETIPYETVFVSSRPLTTDDVRRGQEIWEELGSERAA